MVLVIAGWELYQKQLHCKEIFRYTLSPMITKRQLGIGLALLGAVVLIGTFLVDVVGAGNFSGIGPYQRLALAGGAAVLIIGLTLIPLGDKPA